MSTEIIPVEIIETKPLEKTMFEKIREKCFGGIVGQVAVVRQLIQSVLAVMNGGEMLSPLLLAPAGTGKTALLKGYAAACEAFLGIPSMVLTPAEFRTTDPNNPADIWQKVLRLLNNGRYFLGLDECHELYKRTTVQTHAIASLSMRALDGNFEGGYLKLNDTLEVLFDRRNCSLTMATNYPGMLPGALGGQSGRAPRIELSLYSEDELKQIAVLMLEAKEIKACIESLGIVARCGRGTARPLEHIVRKLDTNLHADAVTTGKRKHTVNKVDILTAIKDSQMYPRGYNASEVSILNGLKNPMTQQIIMARFPSVDLKSWREFAGYAMGNGHVGKGKGGFQLIDAGRKYLEGITRDGFAVL